LFFGGETIIFYIMCNLNMADTGGQRNEKPLTEEQMNLAREYAVSLGMPDNKIRFTEYDPTGYWHGWDILSIGTDVLPLDERSEKPNSNISMRGTIAHEIVGHRDANMKGLSQENSLLEEAQASIRAARFAPGLSRSERLDLIRDGLCRLKRLGVSVREVKDVLHINER
jgi:hypothetical protein